MRMWLLASLALFVAANGLARAETSEAPNCRNGIFVEDGVSYVLAKITGEGKASLLDDNAACPNDSPAFVTKAYVLPNDIVIAARSFGAYRCVFYRDQKNSAGAAGYLPETLISLLPVSRVSTKDWIGAWRMADDYIRISAKRDGQLSAEGEAFWPSANPPLKDVPGGPHLGQMSGVAMPKGNQVTFVDDEKICEVKLTLLPPFLLSNDNGSCGGANVYFRGVFMRRK